MTTSPRGSVLRGIFLGSPFAIAAAAALGACAGEDRRSGFDDGSDGAGTSSPGLVSTDAGLPDAIEGDGGACLSETLAAEPVPLAMLLVMDRSGSMNDATTPTKWDMARQAMIAFADTPGAVGSKLGLTVFPPDPESGLDQCQPSSYQPIVPIAPLPGNGIAIKEALLARSTTGSTPMYDGLKGGIEAMTAHVAANPNEEGVVILVTDGDPGACSGVDTVSNVASVAQAGATATPRIRTFVVGMQGATFANLDTIAKAGGGAPAAFNASGGATDAGTPQEQLLDALEKIRSGALGCAYVVPKPEPSKGSVDPDTVEIEFTAGTGDEPKKFERVADAAACGATTGGFYYDDPKDPKRIILCPASCESVRAGTTQAKLDVVLGCIEQVN